MRFQLMEFVLNIHILVSLQSGFGQQREFSLNIPRFPGVAYSDLTTLTSPSNHDSEGSISDGMPMLRRRATLARCLTSRTRYQTFLFIM